MEQRVVKIDLLDYLFSNVGIFDKLDFVGRKKIFNSRPQPVFDSVVDFVNGKRYETPFSSKYYEEFPWMTACPKRKVLFCYVCLLDGRTVESVICTKNNAIEAAQAHEASAMHMAAYDSCLQRVFDADSKNIRSPDRSAQLKAKRKAVFWKIVQMLYLLKCQAYFDKLGRRFAFDTIGFMALNDVYLSVDWDRFFPELKTNPTLEAAIFATIRDLVFEHVKNELATVNFISMQILDVSEFTAKPTVSIIFRYILSESVVERFGGFYELAEYDSKIDESTLVEILDYWDVRQKLVGIACDFHSDRLPKAIPDRPFRLFNVTAVGHDAKYTAVKIAFVYKEIRDFIGRIQRVVSCLKLLDVDGLLTDDVKATNLTSDSTPIDVQITSVSRHQKTITEALNRLKKDSNIGFNASLVAHTEKLLKDNQFTAYSDFFEQLLEICDSVGFDSLKNIKERLWELNAEPANSIGPPNSKKFASEGKSITRKIITDVIRDFEIRARSVKDFAIGQLFELNANREDIKDVKAMLDPVLTETKGLIDFKVSRLKTEIQVLLKDATKELPAWQLFENMAASETLFIYTEFEKILKLHLTLPTSAVGDDDSTTKRVKDFARATRCSPEAIKFDSLMIESQMTLKLMGDSVFSEYLLDSLSKNQSLSDLFPEDVFSRYDSREE